MIPAGRSRDRAQHPKRERELLYAEKLAKRGYVASIPNSFAARCTSSRKRTINKGANFRGDVLPE